MLSTYRNENVSKNTLIGILQSIPPTCGLLFSSIIVLQCQLNGFFRGMTFPLLSSGVVSSVFFGVYGHACHFLGEHNYGKATKVSRPQFAVIYFAGCLAGVVQLGIVVPFEVVKVKLQSQSQGGIIERYSQLSRLFQMILLSRHLISTETSLISKTNSYRGSMHCLHQLWLHNKFRGCYQGFWIQTYRYRDLTLVVMSIFIFITCIVM